MKSLTLFFKVFLKKNFELFKVLIKYGKYGKFYPSILVLNALYFFKNPYQIAKHEGELCYGETPLSTLDLIAREFRILSKDRVLELGCGSGHTAFWLSTVIGCPVLGVDCIEPFIRKANRVKKWFQIQNLQFEKKNFLELNFSKFNVVYLCGTSFSETLLKKLAEKLRELPEKTKVISVSFPINDYDSTNSFELTHQIKAPFFWGKADVYLSIKK